MWPPVEVLIDLPGFEQPLQLAQTGERRRVERVRLHRDVREKAPHLPSTAIGIPLAAEGRQDLGNLVETDTVAAVVTGIVTELDRAIGEGSANCLGDLAHAIVVAEAQTKRETPASLAALASATEP